MIFWTKFPPKRVLSTKNRKSKHHHWILHIWISLHGKFRLKSTIFIFWTKFSPKRVLPTKNRNSKPNHWILHIGISLGTQFQLQFWFFGPKLPKKYASIWWQKNRAFAWVHGRYLWYLTFPHGSQQTQRYFNVFSPSSRTDK